MSVPGALAQPALPERALLGPSVRFYLAAAGAFALALLGRLAFRIDYAEEIDSLRFLLALERYDVTAHQPHFPGYPVFIALGKAALALHGDPVAALATVCALCGALLVIPVGLLARETLGEEAAWFALALTAVNPFLWLYSNALLSDVPGLLFCFTALALFARGLRGGSGLSASFLVLGLSLGVRLSYFPLGLSMLGLALWHRRPVLRPLLAGAAGVAAWLVPLVAWTGVEPLIEIGRVQGSGHFQRWGGSVVTEPDLLGRAEAFVWALLPNGLGTWWPDRSMWLLFPTLALLALLWLGRARPSARLWGFWLAVGGPYLVWCFLGQNIPDKPRHALPLVVLLLVLLAGVLARAISHGEPSRRLLGQGLSVLVLGGQLLLGLFLGHHHQSSPSPAVELARQVGRLCASPEGGPLVVYSGYLDRHLSRYAPCATPVRVLRLSQAERDLAERPLPVRAYAASDLSRIERLRSAPIATFSRDRYLPGSYHQLALYRLDSP